MNYNIKRLSDYSNKSLLNEIKRVAKKTGKQKMSYKEFNAAGGRISYNVIRRRFGSWNTALRKAGLSVKKASNIPLGELFAEIEKAWNQLGRQPLYREMDQMGKFSVATYNNRFGGWIKAVEEFTKWKSTKGDKNFEDLKEIKPDILSVNPRKRGREKKVEYGEPIDFLGLRHAPLNEQGVVYLFGMLSRQLGFIVEAVRTDFPDCEGKRQIPGKKGRWERVSIEFEYKSSNFKGHGHNPDECDVIVCWEHDWENCPVEVISLKELMKKERKE
ncbi:MAG: homing endonuclease associated repeat-containing protein [Planctomycetota bacterium]|jgi:hypothetical protein